MAVTFVRLAAPAVNSTSATPFLTVGASGAASGDVVVVTAANPSGSAATGVADNATSTTNVWTFFKSASVAGLTVEVWACKLTTALASGNTITVTYGASHAVTLAALEFTGQTGALTADVSKALATAPTDVAPLDAVTTTNPGDFVVEVTANSVIATVDVPVPPGYTVGASQVAAAPAAYTNYVIPAGMATETPGSRQWTQTTGSVGSVQVAFLAAPVFAKAASPPLIFPARINPYWLRTQLPFMSPGRLAYTAPAVGADALAATPTGVAALTAALTLKHLLGATTAGVAAGSAVLSVKHLLATTATGVGAGSAALSVKHLLGVTAAGVAAGSAGLSVKHLLATTAAGVSATTAALSVKHQLASSNAGVGLVTAGLSVKHLLASSNTGVGLLTAGLSLTHKLASSPTGVSGTTAALSVSGGLKAVPVGVGRLSAGLSVAHQLTATAAGVGSASSALSLTHRLATAPTGVSATTAGLSVVAAGKQLAATATGVGASSAALTVRHALSSTIAGVARLAVDLTVTPLAGPPTAATTGGFGMPYKPKKRPVVERPDLATTHYVIAYAAGDLTDDEYLALVAAQGSS